MFVLEFLGFWHTSDPCLSLPAFSFFILSCVYSPSDILTFLFFGYTKLVPWTFGSGIFAPAHLSPWNVLPSDLCRATFLACFIYVSASESRLSYFLTPYPALFFVLLTVSFQYFKIYLFAYMSPTLKCKFFEFTLMLLMCGTVYNTT